MVSRGTGHTLGMTILLIVLGVFAVWSVLTLPMAVAVGRAFRAGECVPPEEIVSDYDAAGV